MPTAQLSHLVQQHSAPVPHDEEEGGDEEVQVNNRVAGGAGKRLSVEDLQVCYCLKRFLSIQNPCISQSETDCLEASVTCVNRCSCLCIFLWLHWCLWQFWFVTASACHSYLLPVPETKSNAESAAQVHC